MGSKMYWVSDYEYNSGEDLGKALATGYVDAGEEVHKAIPQCKKVVYVLNCPAGSVKEKDGKCKLTERAPGVRIWWRFEAQAKPEHDFGELSTDELDNRYPMLTGDNAFAMREGTGDRKPIDFRQEAWDRCKKCSEMEKISDEEKEHYEEYFHPALFRLDSQGNLIANLKYVDHGCTDLNMDVDHVLAWARGGLTHPDNLQALQSACNRAKGEGAMPKYTEYKSVRKADMNSLIKLVGEISEENCEKLGTILRIPFSYMRPDDAMKADFDACSQEITQEAEDIRRDVRQITDRRIFSDTDVHLLALEACVAAGMTKREPSRKVATDMVGFCVEKIQQKRNRGAAVPKKVMEIGWCDDFAKYWDEKKEDGKKRPTTTPTAKQSWGRGAMRPFAPHLTPDRSAGRSNTCRRLGNATPRNITAPSASTLTCGRKPDINVGG